MSADVLETVLTGTHYDAVTEPVFSALELFARTYENKPPTEVEYVPAYVFAVFRQALASKELVVKRFTFLVLLQCLPPIQQYVVSVSPDRARTERFLAWLADGLEQLFRGAYAAFASPVAEFVSTAAIMYHS